MDLKQSLAEVTQQTRTIATGESADESENGFKRFFIRVPQVRALAKQPYSFTQTTEGVTLLTWDHIWKKSPWYEVSHQALYYYQHTRLSKMQFSKIKTWINRCDCWEHSDDLSKIYAQVVEDNPDWILPIYQKWNTAMSPWKRRQSVVGLIEYASKRKRVLPFTDLITFVDPLLGDADYYVQKGIGWTLREIYNVYPDEALQYIEENLARLSPNAYSTSTEKLDKDTRKRLREQRKSFRSNST